MTRSESKATVPSLNLAPRSKVKTKRRRHSVSETKEYFSRSVRNLKENIGRGEKKPDTVSRTHSTGDVHKTNKDPTASPRQTECVDNFFADYYRKHPISRLDEVQLADNPNLEL